MSRYTSNISFQCRQSKANKKGLAPIEIVIIINKERTSIQTEIKVSPDEFKESMSQKKDNRIKTYCNTFRFKLDNVINEMAERGIPITAANVKKHYQAGGVAIAYTLRNLFDDTLTIIKKRVGRDMTQDTYNRYVKSSEMFVECNNLTWDTPANTITRNHFINYQAELGKKLSDATSCNYLQKIKTFFKNAFEDGKIPSNPSATLRIKKGVSEEIKYLTPEEIDRIREADMGGIERLEHVKDCFLFACFTAISFADLKLLQPSDYQQGPNNFTYVKKKRKKTGKYFIAILLEDADEIAKRYNYSIPIYENQTYNRYLKEIQTIAHIDKKLTTHVARHTAATYLLNHGFDEEEVAAVLGDSVKVVRRYAKLIDTTLFNKAAALSFNWVKELSIENQAEEWAKDLDTPRPEWETKLIDQIHDNLKNVLPIEDL